MGAEVGAHDALPDERRGGRHHRLGEHPLPLQRQLVLVVRVGDRHQAGDALELDDRAHHAGEAQDIPGGDEVVGLHRGDHLAVADDLGEVEAVQVAQPRLLDVQPGEVTVRADRHLHQVLPGVAADRLEEVGARRQQPVREQDQVGDAGEGAGQAEGADLEQAHRPQRRGQVRVRGRGVGHQPVDHEVGGGADEGRHAAEDRHVGERDQQARRRHPVARAPARQHRDEHRHHRGVVEEGGQRRHHEAEPQHHPDPRPHRAEQALADEVECARLAHPGRHHVERRHREHAGVGEA